MSIVDYAFSTRMFEQKHQGQFSLVWEMVWTLFWSQVAIVALLESATSNKYCIDTILATVAPAPPPTPPVTDERLDHLAARVQALEAQLWRLGMQLPHP